MSQVVELASEAEGFAEHSGLPPAAGGASRHITASGVTQNLELDPLATNCGHATAGWFQTSTTRQRVVHFAEWFTIRWRVVLGCRYRSDFENASSDISNFLSSTRSVSLMRKT